MGCEHQLPRLHLRRQSAGKAGEQHPIDGRCGADAVKGGCESPCRGTNRGKQQADLTMTQIAPKEATGKEIHFKINGEMAFKISHFVLDCSGNEKHTTPTSNTRRLCPTSVFPDFPIAPPRQAWYLTRHGTNLMRCVMLLREPFSPSLAHTEKKNVYVLGN